MNLASTGGGLGQGLARHHHFSELQSIRGLAALLVVLHHCSFAFIGPGRFNLVAQACLNAHAAVVLFYVLSGYVLTRSLIGHNITIPTVGRFYASRAFRIYPALWAVVSMVGLYYVAGIHHYQPAGLSDWFHNVADHPPWKRYFAKAALGVDPTLLPSLWSITVELQGSLILPLIALVVRRGVWAWVVMQAILIALAWSDWPTDYTRYIHAFGAGAGICLFAGHASRLNVGAARLVAGIALAVMLFFRLASADWRFLVDYSAVFPCIVEAVAAAVFLGVIVAKPAVAPFLQGRIFTGLGDISYSLYLVHLIVMIGIAKVMLETYPASAAAHPLIATGVLMAGTVAVAAPVSIVLYNYAEKPGIAVGKWFVRNLSAAAAQRRPT